MLKIYLNFFMVFCKILFSLHEYKNFLYRESAPGPGYGLIKKPLSARIMNEKRGKNYVSRETMFLHLSCLAFEDKISQKELKEELLVLSSILLLWYCEPLPESEPPTE
tara:strand:- start:2965 stop:3288 length:324 start_codon:yes stop_codon:yes gene_type:complete